MSTPWRYATEDATAIADGAYQLAKGLGGLTRARAVRDAWPRHDRDAWASMIEMGWLGMLVPETQGGLGMAASDVVVLLENLGRMLVPEPILQGIVSAQLLAALDGAGNADLLKDLLEGSRRVLTVSDVAVADVASVRSLRVPDATADVTLLVAADNDGFEIKAIACDSPGVMVTPHACVDGSSLSEVRIDPEAWQAGRTVGGGDPARFAWQRASDLMLLGYSAQMVGLMHEALQITLGYMALRKQFGQPIGAFQALQHRAASCYVAIVSTRATVHEACRSLARPVSLHRAAAIAKAAVSDAVLHVTKECVQFHGAIGFTDEHDIGLFLRRAMTLAARQGNARDQRASLIG